MSSYKGARIKKKKSFLGEKNTGSQLTGGLMVLSKQ
jgi:hypothetical protein